VLDTDRIRDEFSGNLYMVVGVDTPPTLIGETSDVRLDLKRVSAAGV
jgi:hypothetical protein